MFAVSELKLIYWPSSGIVFSVFMIF